MTTAYLEAKAADTRPAGTTETVEVLCAWCQRAIGHKEMETRADDLLKGQPSHGICPTCYVEFFGDLMVGRAVTVDGLSGVIMGMSVGRDEPVYHVKLDDFEQTVVRVRGNFEVVK